MKDPKKMTTAELEELLKSKKQEEREAANREKKQYEMRRSILVERLCASAQVQSNSLKKFKEQAMSDLKEFRAQMQEYAKSEKSDKGNFHIVNEAGNLKVEFASQIRKAFDERATEAEKLLREFLGTIIKGRNKEAYDLVASLLERKISGEYDIRLIQRLYKMETRYEDPNWKKAIALFKESYTETDTCEYVRFYKKDGNNNWVLISLNLSSI